MCFKYVNELRMPWSSPAHFHCKIVVLFFCNLHDSEPVNGIIYIVCLVSKLEYFHTIDQISHCEFALTMILRCFFHSFLFIFISIDIQILFTFPK